MTISYFAKFVAEISEDSSIIVGRAVEGMQQWLLMTQLLLYVTCSFVYTYNCQFIFIFHLLMFPCFRCQITGMKHCTFIDRTREPPNRYQVFNHCNNIWKCVQCYYVLCFEPGVQECREVVTIGEWTDRIYEGTPPEHIITNVVSGRKMRIQK